MFDVQRQPQADLPTRSASADTLTDPLESAGQEADSLVDPLAAEASLAPGASAPNDQPPPPNTPAGPSEPDSSLIQPVQTAPALTAGAGPSVGRLEPFALNTPGTIAEGSFGASAATEPSSSMGSWSARELDGVVDPYMTTNWVDTEFQTKVTQFGITPEGLGTEVDQVIPTDASSETRKGINVGTAIASGVIDTLAVTALKSIPVAGIAAHVVYGIRDVWGHIDKADMAGGDPFPVVLNVLRSVIDIVASSAGNLSDTCGLVTAIGAAVTVPTAGGGAVVAGAAEMIAKVLDVVGLITDGAKLALSGIGTVYNVVRAEVAEANGQFGVAADYRDLAMGNAINTVVDALSVIGDLVGIFGSSVIPAEAGENLTEEMAKGVAKKGTEKILKAIFLKYGLFKGLAIGGGGAGGYAGYDQNKPDDDSSIVGDILATIGLGNSMSAGLGAGIYAMSTEGLTAMNVDPELDAEAELFAAWAATDAKMDSARSMATSDPMWSQSVLNDIMNPSDVSGFDVVDSLLHPTTLLSGAMFLCRKAGVSVSDASSVVSGIGVLITALETTGQPFFDLLNDQVVGWKGEVGGFMDGIADGIQQQQVSMEAIRNGMGSVSTLMDSLDSFADQGGGIAQTIENAKKGLVNVNPVNAELPWWLQWMYKIMIIPLNAGIEGMRAGLTWLGTDVRGRLDTEIEKLTGFAREQMAVLEAALEEGGSVESTLMLAQAFVAMEVEKFANAVNGWDPASVSLSGAIEWLRQLQTAVPNAESAQSRMIAWHEFVGTDGQTSVDQWRAKWGDDVEFAYQYKVQPHEMAAVTRVFEATMKKIDTEYETRPGHYFLNTKKSAAHLSFAACQAASGMGDMSMKGQRIAMHMFWTGARDIANIHRELYGDAWHSVMGPPAGAGGSFGFGEENAGNS